MNAVAKKYPDDFNRIVDLPRRKPVSCEYEPGTRRWPAATQALIEVVTAKYTLGERLSCGCQTRHLVATSNGGLLVFREGPPDRPPPPPLETTVNAFCKDNRCAPETVHLASGLRTGQKLEIPGLGYSFCIKAFNPVQSWALWEIPIVEGAFGLITVGGGKSLLGLATPMAMPRCKTTVLLARSNQRIHYQQAYLRMREHFRVPSIVFDKSDLSGSYIVSGAPIVHFIPYTLLSNPKSSALLDSIDIDTVVADEWHLLSNVEASCTIRFKRLMERENVRLCGWSGSTIKGSIRNGAHLAAYSLGLGSPYPIKTAIVNEWAAVIDPVIMPDTESETAEQLYRVSRGEPREWLRQRTVETPGVISTTASSATASISISLRVPPKMPKAVEEALAKVRGEWMRPDGEIVTEALDRIECAREVACGFYNHWIYPRGEEPDLIDDWFAKRKLYSRELRARLQRAEVHLDSPKLCYEAAARAFQEPRYDGPLPVWPCEAWREWSAIENLVQPESRAVWIDDYLARDAAQWAKENKGVVWCLSDAFGQRVAELCGLPYHNGGVNGERDILAETGKRSVIVSINAFGASLDGLQYLFHKQLITQLPSSSDRWEQLFGRLCRPGQQKETIETFVYMHFGEAKDALRKAIMLAQFVEQTTPNQQLLLAADIDFPISRW